MYMASNANIADNTYNQQLWTTLNQHFMKVIIHIRSQHPKHHYYV